MVKSKKFNFSIAYGFSPLLILFMVKFVFAHPLNEIRFSPLLILFMVKSSCDELGPIVRFSPLLILFMVK